MFKVAKNYDIITPDMDNIDNYKTNLGSNFNTTSIMLLHGWIKH